MLINNYAHTKTVVHRIKLFDATNDVYNYLVDQFLNRYQNDLLLDVFNSYFISNSTTHDYGTREQNFLRVPEYKIYLGTRSIRYRGIKWTEMIETKIDV